MRLKKERWLVEEQMQHVQGERKMNMKEQKCLPEERYGAAIRDRKEGGRKVSKKKKSTRWQSERTWQNERDSDYVEEDRNKMALTT
ncbi:hypothetical protein TNCV_104771 [Trichonephila clavipes]|nr:hypothetical protein TNCV_104771 [Trichonephila clavipes]